MNFDTFHFPRLKFSDENGLYKQLKHINLEHEEVWQAFYSEPIGRVAEELADLAQSCMTALYIIERLYNINPLDVIERVVQKNISRNYDIKKEETDGKED